MIKTEKNNRLNLKFTWGILASICAVSFIFCFHEILMPFIASFIIAYALQPLMRWNKKGPLSRQLAALLIVIGFFSFFIILIFGSFPFIVQELTTLAQRFPQYAQRIQIYLSPWYNNLKMWVGDSRHEQIQNSISDHLSSLISWAFKNLIRIFTSTMAIANLVSLLILTPLLTFYFLRDWPKIVNFIESLIPLYMRTSFKLRMDEIHQTLSAYLRGQLLMCSILATYYSIGLTLIGLEFSITVGTVAGFLAFIPYIGYTIGLITAVGVAIVHMQDWHDILWVLFVFGGGQFIESFILLPKLVGDQVGLHGAWVIFALLAGGLLMGFWGLLFAVPTVAILKVIFRLLLENYHHSLLFQGVSLKLQQTPSIKTNVEIDNSL